MQDCTETYALLLPTELDITYLLCKSRFPQVLAGDFRYNLAWYPAGDLDRLPALSESMCYDLTERELFNRPHVNRWRAGLRNLRFPLPENPVIQIAPEEWRRHVRDLEMERLNRIAARVEACQADV